MRNTVEFCFWKFDFVNKPDTSESERGDELNVQRNNTRCIQIASITNTNNGREKVKID